MQFAQIPGSAELSQKLVSMVNSGRLGHALLFAGSEGCGSLAIARAFVQYLYCQQPGSKDSCGECSQCRKVSSNLHADIHWFFPVSSNKDVSSEMNLQLWIKSIKEQPFLSFSDWISNFKNENSLAQISVKEVSEMLRRLSLHGYESDQRTVIIWLPERLNTAASNKLLKIIEEPPEGVLFVLVSEQTDLLLPTILSRVQLIKVKTPDHEHVASWLQETCNLDEQSSLEIAYASECNLNKAQKLALNSGSDLLFELFIRWMRASYAPNVPDLLMMVDEIAQKNREYQKAFITYSIGMIRKFLMMNFSINSLVRMSNSEKELDEKFIKFFPSKIHGSNASEIVEILTLAHAHISQNGNPKIIFTDVSLKISPLLKMAQ